MFTPSPYLIISLATLIFALPSPPAVFNSDDTPLKAKVDLKLDASLTSLEGLTHNIRDESGRKNGPSEKYFHESTVSLFAYAP